MDFYDLVDFGYFGLLIKLGFYIVRCALCERCYGDSQHTNNYPLVFQKINISWIQNFQLLATFWPYIQKILAMIATYRLHVQNILHSSYKTSV